MRYLVAGGAGFVGSHTVLALLDAGHEVTVIDNLTTGHRKAVPRDVELLQLDLSDHEATENAVGLRKWDGVFHFAALSQVGESMLDPLRYFRHNYVTSLNLIQSCVAHNVHKFVFSSTAALCGGPPREGLIDENAPVDPDSPYGESKHSVERVLRWANAIHGLGCASLRYFNAAGADPQGRVGEDHRPETHLIPLAIDAALQRRPSLKLFGNDYPTPDGSCIRDYVHVTDLADAHLKVLDCIENQSIACNIGNGKGYSVLEVLNAVERVSGRVVPWEVAPRRKGDPAKLVADPTHLSKVTGWSPHYSQLTQIVETALNWREKNPQGYDSL